MSEQKNGADGNAMGSNKGAEVHGSAQSGGIYTPNPPNTPKNVQMLHPPQQQPMVYNISSPSYQTAQHHSQPPSVQGHYVNEHQHHMTSPLNYGKQGQGDQSANAVHIVVSSSSNHQPQQMGMQTQNEHLQELPRQRYPQQQQAHGPPPRSNAQDRRSRDNISQPVYTAYQSVPQQHTPQMQQTMSTGQPQQMHQQSQQGMAIPQSPQQPHAQQQIYYQQRQDIGQPQQLGAPPAPHPIHQSISSQNPAFQIQHTSRSNAPSRNITIQQGVVASMPTKPQNQQHQQPQQYMGSTVPQQNTQKQSESIIAQQSPYNQTNNSGQQAQQMNIQNQTQHYAPISLQPPQQSGRNMLSPHTPQQQLLSNSGGEAQLQSQGTSPNNLSGHMSIPQQPPHASHQVVEQHQIPTTIYQQHQQSQQASQQQYLQQQVQSFTTPPTPHPPQQQHQAAPPTFIVTHGAPPAGASGVQGSQQPQMQRIYIQQQGAPPQQHIIMGHPSQLPMQGTVVHAGPPPPPTAHIAVAQQPIPAQAISHQPQPVAYNGSDRFYVNSVIAATAAISNPNNETTVINPKEKYRELKRKLKFLVYENEYYQEELRNLQRKLLKLSRDKNFLLDRLGNHETNSTESSDDSEASVKTLEERAPKQRKRTKPAPGRKKGTAVTATGSATSSTNGSVLSKRGSSSMLKTKGEAPQSNSEGAKVSAAGSTDSLATTSSQCTVATTTVKIEDFGSQVTDSQAGQGQPLSASVSDTPGSQAGSASNFASSSNTGPHPFPSSSNGVAIMPESAMSTSEVLNQFSQGDSIF